MEKYQEIFKLKKMLEEAEIPFEFSTFFDGFQIRLNSDVDAVEHWFSYGNEQDLLEIMGGLTLEEQKIDSVIGYLTAEEVFKRFKYCYKNKTSNYEKEK